MDPVPSAFGGYFDALEEQRSNVTSGFHHCFGCGPAHPTGLRVRAFRTPDGVVSPILVAREYEGPPGAVHGGIVAAYLDEVLAAAVVRATGRVAVTGELTVRYVQPAPSATPLLGHARLLTSTERYADVEGRLEEYGSERLLATGRGRFFFVDPARLRPA